MKQIKEIALFSSNLYSHPEKLLYFHLENVAERCVEKFRSSNHRICAVLGEQYWENLIWLIGFAHDLGKATSYFQNYLFAKDEKTKKKMRGDPKTSHGLLSALLAHWIGNLYIGESLKNNNNDTLKLFPFFIFLMIKKHHGNLNNAVRMPDSDADNELDIVYEHLDLQMGSLNSEEINHLFSFINKKLGIVISFDSLPDSLNEYFRMEILRKERKCYKKTQKKLRFYFLFQFLYSLLLHSDKEDVIFGTGSGINRESIDCNAVKKFKSKAFNPPQNEMDHIRESIFRDSESTILKADVSKKIFSLNVPTGTGKTLTSLSTALQLRSRLEKAGQKPRIIYALPFTSIIDQNYQVFDEILEHPSSSNLLKHHHMAEIFYKTKESEFETDQSKFLIESWESEIIVTTFFQIFHTLFTNRNRMAQKFHKFAGSIVLLDEIQAVPHKYWNLISKTFLEMSELLNTCFILITATQPRIFKNDEIVELVPKKAEYFSKLDRVNIQFESAPIGISKFIEFCCKEVEQSEESFLFVMNTINSAVELFKSIRESPINAEFYFLSTNIIPQHRFERISQIKASKNRKVIISTQMVEAGVDIDIENVWRDFGPLESINQVCGRCNRNYGQKKGNVRIFQILNDDKKNTPFSKYIYGQSPLSLAQTRETLGNAPQISETDFLKNMDLYYEKINLKMNSGISESNLNYLRNLQFADINNSFRLIEDANFERKDVFIEIGDHAKAVWEMFLDMKSINEPIARKNKFLEFRKDFYDYVISVPSKYVLEKEFENFAFIYINSYQLEQCYDVDIGWIRTTDNYQSYIF